MGSESQVFETAEGEVHPADGKPRASRPRTYVLLGLLAVVCMLYGLHQLDQWLLRRNVLTLAQQIVDGHNVGDPLLPGEMPTKTECTITVSRRYLVFGQPTGKITFRITDRTAEPSAGLVQPVSTASFGEPYTLGVLEYIYERRHGTWKLLDSYVCHDGLCTTGSGYP